MPEERSKAMGMVTTAIAKLTLITTPQFQFFNLETPHFAEFDFLLFSNHKDCLTSYYTTKVAFLRSLLEEQSHATVRG